MLIGVPLETAAGETRVAVTPETAKKLIAQNHVVRVQSGAGVAASVTDEAYAAAGAEIVDRAAAFACEMVLKVQEDGKVRDIPIRAGEIFYLPARVPHSPQRMPNSIGLVIERKRLPHEKDGLLWFCEQCNAKLYEEFFILENIEQDFPPVFDRFYSSREHRTCKQCGHLNPAPAKYVMPDT